MDIFYWLQEWYKSNCNGDWEHSYGIRIDTLDNPGWRVEIELDGTDLDDKTFDGVEINHSDADWILCRVEDNVFNGSGDPNKLTKILEVFKAWATKSCDKFAKDDAIKICATELNKNGFERAGQIWCKHSEDVTFVFEIVNSKWSDTRYYIDIGIIIDEFSTNKYPGQVKIHVSFDDDENSPNPLKSIEFAINTFAQNSNFKKIIENYRSGKLRRGDFWGVEMRKYIESLDR